MFLLSSAYIYEKVLLAAVIC